MSLLLGLAASPILGSLVAGGHARMQGVQQAPVTIPIEIQRMKTASGGPRWNSVTSIAAEGVKVSFGLTGRFRVADQLVTGFFERRADYRLFANAEGLDRAGRWREDNSGQVHPLDSEEAAAVAASESYLERRGYFFPERLPATFRVLEPAREQGRAFDRVLVTPGGGRGITLWIDARTHLLDRASMQLSTRRETIRYGDYRPIDGLVLPFRLSLENGDESETGTATLSSYRVDSGPAPEELARPNGDATDARLPPGSGEASATAYLDPHTGFYIVEARIDGKGPYPFILDTGGHDILTPSAAHELGLSVVGRGFSTGAGAGSAPTEFTKVRTIALGEATVSDQPMTVLHLDLGTAGPGDTDRKPVAGILGLELFERFAITMDYGGGKIILRPRGQGGSTERGVAVPIRFTSDMPLINGTLDGHAGTFGVDTGNNTDLIVFRHWALAEGLGPLFEGGQSMSGSSVGGGVRFRMARADSFRIGTADIGSLDIMVAQENAGSLSARSEAGNLGNSVLSRFAVTFDYRSEMMYLAPAAGSPGRS